MLLANFIFLTRVLRSSGVADPNDPFNNNAQANSWTPPLNTSWTWGKDKIYGYVCFGASALSFAPLNVCHAA